MFNVESLKKISEDSIKIKEKNDKHRHFENFKKEIWDRANNGYGGIVFRAGICLLKNDLIHSFLVINNISIKNTFWNRKFWGNLVIIWNNNLPKFYTDFNYG